MVIVVFVGFLKTVSLLSHKTSALEAHIALFTDLLNSCTLWLLGKHNIISLNAAGIVCFSLMLVKRH